MKLMDKLKIYYEQRTPISEIISNEIEERKSRRIENEKNKTK